MQLVWLLFPYGGYLGLMIVLYAILFWVVLPLSFGYIGGRFKRHSIGLPFTFSIWIVWFFWIVTSRVSGSYSVWVWIRVMSNFMFSSHTLGYFSSALVSYIIGFRSKSLAWKNPFRKKGKVRVTSPPDEEKARYSDS